MACAQRARGAVVDGAVRRADGLYRVYYVHCPFRREPDCGVTSVNYDFAELLAKAAAPR